MVSRSLPRGFPGTGGRWAARLGGGGIGLPRGEAARRLLWRTVWAPFWLGSDIPAPRLPAWEPATPADVGLAGDVVERGLDQIRRRLWLRHALTIVVRAVWLGLAVGCCWLLLEWVGGPPFAGAGLIWVTAGLVALGMILATVSQPSRRQTAEMLDRSFNLRERLTTALDHLGRGVPRAGERASVVYLQMADAANVVSELRRQRAVGVRVPVRETVLLVFCGLLLTALFFLRGVGGGIPPVAAGDVPVFTAAVDRPLPPTPVAAKPGEAQVAPTVDEVRQRADRSNAAQRDLQTLARALDDHAVTRSAADAIGQGKYQAAANSLRQLAPSADQLSPSAREELARDLDTASSQMAPGGNDLSQAARETATGLRQGDQAAQQGVRDLGNQVERSGNQVAPQQELADQMRQAEAAQAQGQPGQPGGTDPGQPGDAGTAGETQANEQAGEGRQGASGQPGKAGASQPGEAQSRGQPGGQSGQQGGQQGQPGGQQGQPGDGQPGGQPGGNGQAGKGAENRTGDGQQSTQGSGAGGGQSQEKQAGGQPGAAGGGQDQAAQGVPAEAQVSQGDGKGAPSGEPDPVTETIQLPPSSGGGGVQTSNDGGGSRQGTGSGMTAGSGAAVQGEVGKAGPDSNRVPPAYRSVVERYFSDQPEGGE